MHIETVNLLDGDYELVPANTTTPESVSLINTDLNQDPNQCSEEPKATFEQCQRRQAPVQDPIILRIIFILLFCICCNIFIVHLRFLGVDRKPYMHDP